MHRDDAIELQRIESLAQCGAQSVLAPGGRAKAEDAERRAAPRPCPRLNVMRATARIMFLKRAMFVLDQPVWLASALR